MSVIAVITPTWDSALWLAAMRKAAPEMEVRSWPDLGDVTQIEFAACWLPPPKLLGTFPNLKLILALGAGVDGILHDTSLPREIPLVRAVDSDLTARMSEYVLLHVLLHHREQRRLDTNQRLKEWDSFASPAAKDFSVGIMGLGALGLDAAQKLLMMGYKVRGWSRSAKTIAGVACFSGTDELATFLADTDILVCLLPSTQQTDGILNRKLFSQLSKRGAFGAGILINAGRGRLQNEADILSCLDDGTLHAATLDVFAKEPLPSDSAFWLHPKVTLTPHVAASSDPDAICRFVCNQITQFRTGKVVQHVVDRSTGY